MKKNRKRKIVMLTILTLIVISVWLYWGNTAIQTSYIEIESASIPSEFLGYKIAHVSDLHNSSIGIELVHKIKRVNPDMIAITGDLIDSNKTDVNVAMKFIESVIQIAPVYYVTGNHEAWSNQYRDLKSKLIDAGVIILEDESFIIERGSSSIQLLGINDPNFIQGQEKAAQVNKKLNEIRTEKGIYTILLSHRPELFDIYVENNIDLVLSGHAHGGQIRIPFAGGVYAPKQGFFPDYFEGVYEKGGVKLIVSRGLGNSSFPLRINNRPELVIITLM